MALLEDDRFPAAIFAVYPSRHYLPQGAGVSRFLCRADRQPTLLGNGTGEPCDLPTWPCISIGRRRRQRTVVSASRMDRSIEAVSCRRLVSPYAVSQSRRQASSTGFRPAEDPLAAWQAGNAEQSTRRGAAHVTAAAPDNTGPVRPRCHTLTILKWFRPTRHLPRGPHRREDFPCPMRRSIAPSPTTFAVVCRRWVTRSSSIARTFRQGRVSTTGSAARSTAELFVFLIAPESVAEGHYTRTEVKIAARRWPTPAGMCCRCRSAETPLAEVPAYLRAHHHAGEGNLAAEVVLEVEDRCAPTPAPRPPQPQSPTKRAGRPALSVDATALRPRRCGPLFDRGGPKRRAADTSPKRSRWTQRHWRRAWDRRPDDRRLGAARHAGCGSRGFAARRAKCARAGAALYKALFEVSPGRVLRENLRAIDPQRGEGLRFVINTTDAPDLARLPWEFLYSPERMTFSFRPHENRWCAGLTWTRPPPTLKGRAAAACC